MTSNKEEHSNDEQKQNDHHSDDEYEGENDEASNDLVLAKSEDKWVWRLRFLTAFVLIGLALAVCLVVYFEGRNSERKDFEQRYLDLAEKLVSSCESVIKQRLGIVQNFALDMTSQANGTWPLYIPTDFTIKAESVGRLASIASMFMLHRVTAEQRQDWESFAVANEGWMREGISYLQGVPVEEAESAGVFPTIMNAHWGGWPPIRDDGPGPYWVLYNAHPVSADLPGNANLHRDKEHGPFMDQVYATGTPVFEHSSDFLNETLREQERLYQVLKNNEHLDYQDDPYAFILFPGKSQF